MSRILVLTAVETEARRLARHLGLDPVPGPGWSHYRGGAIEVACVGLRAARLAERAALLDAPRLVLSAGACGALAPHLAVGDLVVPEAVESATGERFVTRTLPPLPRTGLLLCADEVAATPEAKARLWMVSGALAVDMESAPILAWARARGVPAAAVRGVSDAATDGIPAELSDLVAADGRVRTVEALRVALRRPRLVSEAVALGRGTARALSAVADALARLARGTA